MSMQPCSTQIIGIPLRVIVVDTCIRVSSNYLETIVGGFLTRTFGAIYSDFEIYVRSTSDVIRSTGGVIGTTNL